MLSSHATLSYSFLHVPLPQHGSSVNVGTLRGGTTELLAKREVVGSTLQLFDSPAEGLAALAEGTIDGFITNPLVAKHLITSTPALCGLTIIDSPRWSLPSVIPFSLRTDASLVQLFSEEITRLEDVNNPLLTSMFDEASSQALVCDMKAIGEEDVELHEIGLQNLGGSFIIFVAVNLLIGLPAQLYHARKAPPVGMHSKAPQELDVIDRPVGL